MLTMMELQPGSLKATRFGNGKAQVRSYGYTENVCFFFPHLVFAFPDGVRVLQRAQARASSGTHPTSLTRLFTDI